MSIGNVIKKRRKELDLTLLDIAKRIGVSEATVQRWESGNIKNLRHDRITSLADVLDISPAELMGWDSDPQSIEDPAGVRGELIAMLRDPDSDISEDTLEDVKTFVEMRQEIERKKREEK